MQQVTHTGFLVFFFPLLFRSQFRLCPLLRCDGILLQSSGPWQIEALLALKAQYKDVTGEDVPGPAKQPKKKKEKKAAAANGAAYQHFRIFQTGKNASGDDYLFCAGIELYGTLTEAPSAAETAAQLGVGSRVTVLGYEEKAVITKVRSDGNYAVRYDDGSTWGNVEKEKVRPLHRFTQVGGAVAAPPAAEESDDDMGDFGLFD